MSVRDHGIEGLRKATIPLTPGDFQEYQIRTTGTFSLSGLQNGWLPTTLMISDVAAPLPAVALTNRNSIIILNRSSTDSLYIGNIDVTADSVVGATSGWEMLPNSYFATDVKESIVIYGIAPTGKTIKVQVLEVA